MPRSPSSVMKAQLCALCLASFLLRVTVASVVSSKIPSFASFISNHGRSYTPGTQEYEKRRSLFDLRVAEAELHNSRDNRRWTAGVNHLWDWTDEELAKLNGYRGDRRSASHLSSNRVAHVRPSLFLKQKEKTRLLPPNVHWQHLNASQTVRSQEGCGSCWAVAASTILQAHSEIYSSANWRTFSTQELVNCVPNPQSCGGTGGCDGATVELALDWAVHNAMSQEHEVPYEAEDLPCQKAATPAPTFLQSIARKAGYPAANGIQGWERLPENKYEPLMRAVYEKGPVGVSVGASAWHNYGSGIFDNCAKDTVVNHAVTLLGYGIETSTGDKFWQVLNSWGPEWGEKGQIRVLRRDDDDTEYCGTDRKPEDGTGCKGGPSEVTVCGMCGILYDSALPTFGGGMQQAPQQSFAQISGA